ncbi:hypothetical protein EGR_09714 [Echinococcus granulosus]|uniref:Uncharacterized protein n=1 Tax=Echinococcus granulosus TaxID=6210 RepID=W6U2W6_ECHGR|nr:hypothetical protein EGR_09714 [Echinococcus granulosus]EUB55435.1 hypothetical protein EGR_09714 [Echinococcus granulosus]
MGVFAFGVINAYMLRRQNHRLAADAVAHTGEQGPEIVEQSDVRQSTSATESSNVICQINQKEEGEGLEATDETPTRSAGTEDLMKRSASQEPGRSPSTTSHNSQGISRARRKSSSLSSSFRRFFRNRSTSKIRDSFSPTSSNSKSTKMNQRNCPRLCKSLSTFFINCCQCCSCCNGWGNTTDSPPYADEFRHHRQSWRCLCCYCGPWKKGDRVSASEPQLSPPPPTVLPSMRVRFENQVFEMEGNDHISRRRVMGARFRDEVDAKIMGASRDDPVMIERKLNEGDVQKGKEEDELSDSSDTFTIEPNLRFARQLPK